jgi:hypothetical protein
VLSPQHRTAIEDAIEALIALLDALDGDADLEAPCDDDDDPHHCVVTYAGDLDGTGDQSVVVSYLNR